MNKTYSGYTADTAENLLLDAGAFFIDFDIEEDTFEDAVAAGKLLGATRGGGTFTATPEIRSIEVDGVKGKAKGLQVIDSWTVTMLANVLEVTMEGLEKELITRDMTNRSITYEYIITPNYHLVIYYY